VRDGALQTALLNADFCCTGCGIAWPRVQIGSQRLPVLLADRQAGEAAARRCEAILGDLRHIGHLAHAEDEQVRADVEQLATWAAAHWGRFAEPPLPGPDLSWVRDWLPPELPLPDGPVAVLGCGPGAELGQVRMPGRELIAWDGHPLLVAFGLYLAEIPGDLVPYRQAPGRLGVRSLRVPESVREDLRGVRLACADALDPPLAAESCAAVLAFNLVDSVVDPFLLLQQCEALLRPGGVLLLSSPYNWQQTITPPTLWFDRHLPATMGQAAGVEALLTGQVVPGFLDSMQMERAADGVAWDLPVHPRFTAHYRLHIMRLRKAL